MTVTAPVAGRVLVQGLATVTFSHNNGVGVGDEVDLFVGQTATDCPSTYGQFGIATVFPPLPNATYIHSLPVFGVYDVAAGVHTYFLNSITYAANPPDATPQAPPASLDWDAWCGPPPKLPYAPNLGHFAWRLEETYGNGHLVDWGIPWIDRVRVALGEAIPRSG